MLSAPDFRFVNGYIFGCIILLGTIISPSKLRLKAGKGLAIALSVCFIIFIGWHTRRITIVWGKLSGEHMQSTLFYPLHPPYEPIVEEYQMGNFSVYVIGDGGYCNFGMLPVTIAKGLPFTPFHGQKIQDIHTIEARGSSIQDGFRTKPEYIEIMNKNTQKYIEEYSRIYKKKYPLGYFDRVK